MHFILIKNKARNKIAISREEGRQQGKEEGEHHAKIETAKNMLSKGLDINLVSQCTGLTIEELRVLK